MELGIVIVILNNSDLITAQWNRPVGDGDLGLAGEVEMLKILVCEDACELLDSAESSETILSVQTSASADPGRAGGRGGLYCVAVVGVDAGGITGHVSNIMHRDCHGPRHPPQGHRDGAAEIGLRVPDTSRPTSGS